MSGKLYIVSTPIGNLEDITLRALRILKSVSLIACEDTRETIKLLQHYEIRTPLISYHNFNERERSIQLIAQLKGGKDIALVSDAGTPGISDPGYQIIQRAIEEKITIVPIPGASSILAAIIVSGLATDRFTFEGFLPEKETARKKNLYLLKDENRTMIFFETAKRLKSSLQNILEILGERKISIAHELTKKFESIERGNVSEALHQLTGKDIKGEFVLIISGREVLSDFSDFPIERHIEEVIGLMGISRKEAIKLVASLRGMGKREVYQQTRPKPLSSQ